MKTIGIIGGISWESTAEYYRILNQEVNRRLGGTHSAKIRMFSFDFDEIYNFNKRTFVRGIIQYQHISRNTDMYLFPVSEGTKTVFTQLLFSYKINPQTVLFLGYSDNNRGMPGIDITKTDRSFFFKFGYALVL